METTNKTTPNSNFGGDRGGYKGRGGAGGRGRPSFDRPKPEFDQKILGIRRVTRVVAGGRRFSFSVAMAIGDKKGSVGLGTGKAGDTALAIAKALKDAKKNMIKLALTKDLSIKHDVYAKFCSSKVMIMPNKGKGVVAGSSVRDILNLAGVKDVTSKIYSGSKNKLNNAKAAMLALGALVAVKKIEAPIAVVEAPVVAEAI
ncbi:MAG: 30S ribosomal protein S5 [Candidatus Omnitrophota bacterium]|nr:30S ribosomal protein S5 [Candidatus Omnitrophota bacterium]